MADVDIERATPDDWERVRDLRLRALADAPDAFGTTLAQDEARPLGEWRRRLETPGAATYLAAASGRGLGLITVVDNRGGAGDLGLYALWVAPAWRGRGVGGALIDAVVAWGRRAGFLRIILDVADENIPAIGLYESKGFRRTGATSALAPPRQHILEHERALEL